MGKVEMTEVRRGGMRGQGPPGLPRLPCTAPCCSDHPCANTQCLRPMPSCNTLTAPSTASPCHPDHCLPPSIPPPWSSTLSSSDLPEPSCTAWITCPTTQSSVGEHGSLSKQHGNLSGAGWHRDEPCGGRGSCPLSPPTFFPSLFPPLPLPPSCLPSLLSLSLYCCQRSNNRGRCGNKKEQTWQLLPPAH